MDSPSIVRGPRTPLPESVHLHVYFEQVTSAPNATNCPGLIYGSSRMTYPQLNMIANGVAREIASRLVQYYGESGGGTCCTMNAIIAVDIEPSIDLIIGLLAVLKLGAGYLPVDSHSAVNRVKYILNEAKPLCILTDSNSSFKKEKDTVWSNNFILDVADVIQNAKERGLSVNRVSSSERVGDGRLLAVIYTSGSTGRPKGVRLCHRTAMNRLFWQWTTFPYHTNSVGCFKTSLLFVDSIVEIFSCLLGMVPLVVIPKKTVRNIEALVQQLEEHSVTRLTLVPSLLRNILLYVRVSGGSSRLRHLTLWISNSETLAISLLEKFFDVFQNDKKTFLNLYGSTETMADVTYEVFGGVEDIDERSKDGQLSIGRPLINCNVYVLDESGDLCDKGKVGEICVSGFNVAAGYLDEGQNRHFSINPFDSDIDHQIFYKSGDYATIEDGRLVYLGRRDMQIKIHGQRVNISEIEKVIQACDNTDKVVVLCHKLSEISTVIIAFYTVHVKMPRLKMQAILADACRKALPTYMVPKLIQVDEIPLQPHTGKVDRVALRKLYERVYNRQSTLELQFLDEKSLKALSIIALNLSLPRNAIPLKSSFFHLGGNSISMISTIVQLKEHDMHIPIEAFSQTKCIQDIIDHVSRSPTSLKELSVTEKYIVEPLHKVENCDILVNIIADSFVEKEPLDLLLGITKTEFLPFALSLYKEAMKAELSIVVLEKSSGEIVGGDFLFDFSQTVSVEHHDSMAPIVCLFHHFEPVMEQLRQMHPGRLMLNFCLGVRKDLPHAEQVQICHLLEHSVLETAKEHGFVGVITNNTNPATQDICEHFFQYSLLSEYLVRDFCYNGRRVFAHAPEDYRIKLMIRYLDDHMQNKD